MRRLKIALLYACRAAGLFALARWWTRDCVKILCYHGFELRDETRFRPKLFVSAALFERRMAALERLRYVVRPLDEAVEDLYAGRTRKDTVVITVDDGFRSFHALALPLLRRYAYPATIYVTSYYVGYANPVFRLIVQYMFWKARPRQLEITDLPVLRGEWVDLANPAQAQRLLWSLIDHGERAGDETQRRALCVQLGRLLDVNFEELAAAHVMELMRPAQLAQLPAAGVSVALHTHRHDFACDDRARAEREIADNRTALRTWVGPLVAPHFCYPSGVWHAEQWPWLDAMGVKSSTTCEPGLNRRDTPRHALRRFLDGEDVHQIEFEAAVSGFADLARRLLRREPARVPATAPDAR